MARINLKDCGVEFDAAKHEYWLNGKQLQGITGVITKQLFPNEYDNVPPAILAKSAEYGTAIHQKLEKFDMWFENDHSVEVQDYIALCKEHGLVHEYSEYLCTDGANFASAIDKVFRVSDDTVSIADIKTYYGKLTGSKLERCRWQLSLYQYFMQITMPKLKVDRLLVIHLRNKEKKDGTYDHVSELIEVDPIPSDICKELLDCELRGEQFKNPFAVPEDVSSKLIRIKSLVEAKAAAEEELNTLKADLLSSMQFLDVKTWAAEGVKLTRKLASVRTSLDAKALKAAFPEIPYDQFYKTSTVAESLMVAV